MLNPTLHNIDALQFNKKYTVSKMHFETDLPLHILCSELVYTVVNELLAILYLNEKAISLILQYEILKKLVTFILNKRYQR